VRCDHRILTGPRAGDPCRSAATVIVVSSHRLACGNHSRAYVPRGLARIAYWSEKQRAWL
jgi:hypothetical protein